MIAYALGLMTKPMLVTLPFVLLLLDYWPLGRLVRRWGLVLEKVPLFILAAAFSAVTVYTQEGAQAVLSLESLSIGRRLGNACLAYVWYLEKTIWPFGLSAFYPYPLVLPAAWEVAGAALFLGAVTALALWQVQRRPYLAVGWFWFLGTLVPVIGLVQAGEQAMADRFTYVPHIGLFLALVWGVGDFFAARWPAFTAWAAVAVATCLAGVTLVQQGYWKDTPTLWEHALAVDSKNARAHANLGVFLLEQGYRGRAIRHLTKSVEADGHYAETHYNLGLALLNDGNIAQAEREFKIAVLLKPDSADAWYNLGLARLRLGKPADAVYPLNQVLELQRDSADAHVELGKAYWELGKPAAAQSEFEAALALRDDFPVAHNNLGRVLLRRGDLEQAMAHFQKAQKGDPRSADAYNNAGVAFARRGAWMQAVESMRTACRLEPSVLSYRCNLAYALAGKGDVEAAQTAYAAAFRLDRNWPVTARTTAWKLVTDTDPERRDPTLALELATQACQARGYREAEDVDTLAAAEAAAGNFREAIANADRARALAETAGRAELARQIETRLALYRRAGLPPSGEKRERR
jgi:tetratricopeptide (TPR) repeat protein